MDDRDEVFAQAISKLANILHYILMPGNPAIARRLYLEECDEVTEDMSNIINEEENDV